MAASLFKLVGDIYVNNDEANKSIQKTDDKAQKLGSTLLSGVKTAAKWGAAIAGAATTAVAGLVKRQGFKENECLDGFLPGIEVRSRTMRSRNRNLGEGCEEARRNRHESR